MSDRPSGRRDFGTVLARRGFLTGGLCLVAGCRGHGAPTCRVPGCSGPAQDLPAGERERHVIYLLLTMALVYDAWGIDPGRPDQLLATQVLAPERQFSAYRGHNIGALMVGAEGTILAFASNRSVAMNSTLEHAELRAVRQAIAARNEQGPPVWSFSNLLRGSVLYTTLEPCAQCAGVSKLANLATVVFAQADPGQKGVIEMLHALDPDAAPRPVPARFLAIWSELAAAYSSYAASRGAAGKTGVTYFLQTPEAFAIFRRAAGLFDAFEAEARANVGILAAARQFRLGWREATTPDRGAVPS